jgi:nucleoside phosphorylase
MPCPAARTLRAQPPGAEAVGPGRGREHDEEGVHHLGGTARLQARGQDPARVQQGLNVKAGLLLSGEKLVDDTSFRKQLRKAESEAVGGEMEGAGVAAAANREKTPWIVVKGVSDFADGKKKVKKRERQARAARNAADLVLEVLATVGLR